MLCPRRRSGKDKVEAAKWYRKAAEQGESSAQSNLAQCYDEGAGVNEDFIEAYKWLILAGANGDEEAGEERKRIAKKMTATKIAEAQAQAKKWLQEKEQSRPATK